MRFESRFETLPLACIHSEAQKRHEEGWRYVQICAVTLEEEGFVDLIYSYMKDGTLLNYQVESVSRKDTVPSISDLYLEAFVCENEIHDLFGISIEGIAIDFLGNFYQLSTEFPMTITSPEKLAEQERAAKIAAANAAKEAKATNTSKEDVARGDEELEAKLAAMDPEKAAKVRAAMEAKAKKQAAAEQAKKDEELEAKLAAMDPEKAAKVRAAMEAKAKKQEASSVSEQEKGE